MGNRRVFRGVLWALLAIVVIGHLGGGWHFSNRIIDEGFTPDPGAIVPTDVVGDLEEVTYTSDVGDFDAWFMPGTDTTWVIHVHGLNATPSEPDVLFADIQKAGYPQLSVTYRNDENQPVDPSGYFQYGATEWADVFGAVEFAQEQGAEKLVFMGYSSGAAHVLSYVFRHNFDEIAGVVIDSGNIDLGKTVDFQASQEPLPILPFDVPVTVSWVAKFFTSLRIDMNWKSIDYVDKAERSLRVPVLAFHGVEDESVPVETSIELAENNPDLVTLIQVAGAGHVESFDVDYETYITELLIFIESVS